MIYKQKDKEIIYSESDALGVRLAQCNHCDFVRVTVQPQGRVALHIVEVPVTFVMLSGNALLHIDDAVHRVEGGDLIAVPPGANRGWSNDGAETLEVLAVKHGTC